MKVALVFLLIVSIFLPGCDKTDDEIRAEKSASERAIKNKAAHEKSQ